MKKIVFWVFALALCFAFCACGDNQGDVGNNQATSCPHNYDVIIKEATCINEGSKTYTCIMCGYTYSEKISTKGHTYSDGSCTVCDARKPSEGLEYERNGSQYYVVGMGTCTDTNIVIADYYEGLPVTAVGLHAFSNASKVTAVFLPDTVTRIDMFAFDGCTSLAEVHLSKNLIEIDVGAFSRCENLVTMEFPEGITILPGNIFERCENLRSVTLPDSLTAIEKAAFMNCGSLTEIVIPEGVTSIGDSAFYGCVGLHKIVIPGGVQNVGEGVFRLARNLTHIYCGAESEPFGWHIDWKAVCNAAVYWKNEWEYIDGDPTVK